MIDLTKVDAVKALQTDLGLCFGSDSGKRVMKEFLEPICGWYDFSETDPNAILIAHGKRQILATIKTLLEHSAEQVVAVAKQKE